MVKDSPARATPSTTEIDRDLAGERLERFGRPVDQILEERKRYYDLLPHYDTWKRPPFVVVGFCDTCESNVTDWDRHYAVSSVCTRPKPSQNAPAPSLKDRARETLEDADGAPQRVTLADFAVDMANYVDDGKAEAFLLERSDGKGIVYEATPEESRIVWVAADPGTAKTYFQVHLVVLQLLMGRKVAFCAWEGAQRTIYRRLCQLGLNPAHFAGQMLYVQGGFEKADGQLDVLCDWLADQPLDAAGQPVGPSSIHIESVTASGADNTGGSIFQWWNDLIVPLKQTLSTIILSDHPPKRKEGRVSGPTGDNFKRQQADQIIDFKKGRNWNAESDGYHVLICTKDRHGYLAAVDGEAMARMVFTHERDGAASIRFTQPEDEDAFTQDAWRPMLEALAEAGEVAGYASLLALVPGTRGKRARVVADMKENGLIGQSQKGRGKTRYWVSDTGRDYLAGEADVG